jgi:nucleoside-diphosphate-sugar epimerase
MSPISNPVLLPGSRVLVTGVGGFIGSHIADQLLAEGYLVTGTTRDASKTSWLQLFFDNKYEEGKFGISEISDMAHVGAFDKLLHGKFLYFHQLGECPLTQYYQAYPASCTLPRT